METPDSSPLVDSSPDSDVAKLIGRLGDADSGQSSDALNELIALGAPAVPQLIEAAAGAEPEARQYALHALVRIGDPRAGELCLRTYLDPATGFHARYAALVGIGRCHADGAFDLLAEVLVGPASDEDAERLKAAAVEGLGALGDRRAVPLLLPLVGVDPKGRPPRYVVISALGELGDERAAGALIALVEAEPLDPDPRAITALGEIGNPTALPVLRQILDRAPAIADDMVTRKNYRPEVRDRYREQILEVLRDRVQTALRTIGGERDGE